jgi:hypothetical protein
MYKLEFREERERQRQEIIIRTKAGCLDSYENIRRKFAGITAKDKKAT